MKWFYIRFTYEQYCGGWDTVTETLMVQAIDFDSACDLIADKYEDAGNFRDLTLRETVNF